MLRVRLGGGKVDTVPAAPLPPFKAILLDMDGLSLDTEITYCHAWRQAAYELGYTLDESVCENLFGRQSADVERIISALLGSDYDRERFKHSAEHHWRLHIATYGVTPMPGLENLLARLKRLTIPHALATNSYLCHAEECLHHAHLADAFATIVTRDQVKCGKPAPDLFLEAARRLNVPIEYCVVLEDSETGIEAARSAGAIPVLIQQRESLRLRVAERAHSAYSSLEEFEKILADASLL